jgi:hypothetical protein
VSNGTRRTASRKRRRGAITLDPDSLSPAAAQPLDFDLELTAPGRPPAQLPSHRFRLLRASDLVVLDVACYGIQLVNDGDPVLVAGAGARLVVRFTFQHAAEAAALEPEVNPPPPPAVPVGARAAQPSRLVFDVPDGMRIEYSTAGVLGALSTLALRVAPLATPRLAITLPGSIKDSAIVSVVLPGGVRLARTVEGLAVLPPERRARPRREGVTSLIGTAKALRTARTMLSTERAVDLSGRRLAESASAVSDLGRLILPPELIRPVRQRPRPPRADETAIEIPYRLILSPSVLGGFAHATEPRTLASPGTGEPERTELWHTRLGVRSVDAEGVVTVEETAHRQKIVRAIWTRDMAQPAPGPTPFDTLPKAWHREALVRQTADPAITVPQPVSVERLYLSALGTWLELHGRWNTTPYDQAELMSVSSWDHEATGGRDQFVRIEEPFYLFPIGHKCALVTINERKIKQSASPQALLYQRQFIVVQEPVRGYQDRALPTLQVRIRPLVTPNLDPSGGLVPGFGTDVFWPTVGGQKFQFVLDCLDHDGRRYVLRAPLLAVRASRGAGTDQTTIPAAYAAAGGIPADGQSIAFAESGTPGDTAFETRSITLTGTPGAPGARTSTPRLVDAEVVVPAMRHLSSNAASVLVTYAGPYLVDGFAGDNVDAQVMLELATMTTISFGGGTDRSGGFVQPDLPVRGLSRVLGLVGDQDLVTNPTAGAGFDPTKFLDGVLPKLFGLFSLVDILEAVGLDAAPKFLTDQLDKISAMLRDLDALRTSLQRAVDRLAADAASAATTKLRQQAQDAENAIEAIRAGFAAQLQQLEDAIDALVGLDDPSDLTTVTAAVSGLLAAIAGFVTNLQQVVATSPLPSAVRAELERLANALAPLLDAAEVVRTIAGIVDFVNGFDPSDLAVKASFEWRPEMSNFPAGTAEDDALFFVRKDGFVLAVEARASGNDGVGFDALAELSDFGLNLFPGEPLIKLRFDRLGFRASSGRKPEVDVVFNGLEWCGVLSFIETLQELIPFDGFSDPPYVDVSTEGVTAGFDLALPSVAVGVFSLENISLGADVRVPFLGEAVTVGFNFCTREKPFRLTVMCIGGGGFVGIRLSPKGLVLLEMSLEATACLSIDLVVASGSVSVSVGVYLRLESEKGSLTGYFRIRGEVDVLGLISASITLELSLTYEFDTGKLVGRASLTIEVEILFFSFSVEVSCERRLAGSNGDPTFADFLGIPSDGTPLVTVPAEWSDYCAAFAGA